MEVLWWSLTIFLMLAGLVGTVLPLVPGPILILMGAVIAHFGLGVVGWVTLVILAVLMILGQALDFVSGAAGAKYFGATRWGALGGILGAIVGMFFGFVGLLIGPLAGALICELLAGRGLLPAGRSGWGTFLGTTAGIVGKLIVGVVMIGVFVVAALL